MAIKAYVLVDGEKVPLPTSEGGVSGDYATTDYVDSATVAAAKKLATARTIEVSGAVSSTATSFNGEQNISIPVTAVKESFLAWGGKNFAASFGPLDASMIPDLGANRLVFGKAEGITVEYSRDAGETWTDYGLADAYKVALFSTGAGCIIGKSSAGSTTADCMLRVTIDADAFGVYTILNKFVIYSSTSGSSGCWCTIEASKESTPSTFVKFADKVTLAGWPGYNVINTADLITYANSPTTQYGLIRFTFGCTSHTMSNYAGLTVTRIMGFGGVGWKTPSYMASNGHLYRYDSSQNAYFPSKINATLFDGNAKRSFGMPFVIPNETSSTATLTATYDGITELYDGLAIAFKCPFSLAASTTLNLNGLGAKPVYYQANTASAGRIVGNAVQILVYETATRSDGCWKSVYSYNADYAVRQYQTTASAEYPMLARYNTSDKTGTYDNTYTRFTKGVTLNPSKATITASGGFIGTASKATADADGNDISKTYVKSVNGSTPDESGDVSVGAVTVSTLTSEIRESVITAGKAFDVPAYEVGADQLQVFVDGLLCVKGSQYTEVSSSSIAFTFDLPADAFVVATVTASKGASALTTQVQTSESRDSVLVAGSAYTVPAYSVGKGMCRVYLDGVMAVQGVTWQEVSPTSISFTVDIPTDVEITAVCSAIS